MFLGFPGSKHTNIAVTKYNKFEKKLLSRSIFSAFSLKYSKYHDFCSSLKRKKNTSSAFYKKTFFLLCAGIENSEQFVKSASINIFRLSVLLKYDTFKVYVSF